MDQIKMINKLAEAAQAEEVHAGFKVELSGFTTLALDESDRERLALGQTTLKYIVAQRMREQIASMEFDDFQALVDSVELSEVREAGVEGRELMAEAVEACEQAGVRLVQEGRGELEGWDWIDDESGEACDASLPSMRQAAADAMVHLALDLPARQAPGSAPRGG